MAQFIRVGSRFINLDQVVSVECGVGCTLVTLAASKGIYCGEQGIVESITHSFTGEQGEALAAFFTSMAPDVLAMHGKQQAEQVPPEDGPRCYSCRAVPVFTEGDWCRECSDGGFGGSPQEFAARMADFEARR